jgi:hypothetical protein
MQAPLSLAIREQLANYLSGRLDLRAFNRWFAAAAWTVDGDPDVATRVLAYEIEHRLAEFSNGDWTEVELGRFFQPLVTNYSFGGAPQYTSSTSVVVGTPRMGLTDQSAIRRPIATGSSSVALPIAA